MSVNVRYNALQFAHQLEKTASEIEFAEPCSAQVLRQCKQMIEILAEYAPTGKPELRLVK